MRSFNCIMLASFCIALAACYTSHTQVRVDGGQDTGGGNVPLSTERQVIDAISQARQMIRYDARDHQAGRFVFLKFIELSSGRVRQVLRMVATDGRRPNTDYVEASRILLLSKSPLPPLHPPLFKGANAICLRNHMRTDACVSANEWGSDITFDVDKLRAHSPQSILKDIYALFVHELAHLNGFGETDANLIQTFCADHFYEATTPRSEVLRLAYRAVARRERQLPRIYRLNLLNVQAARFVAEQMQRDFEDEVALLGSLSTDMTLPAETLSALAMANRAEWPMVFRIRFLKNKMMDLDPRSETLYREFREADDTIIAYLSPVRLALADSRELPLTSSFRSHQEELDGPPPEALTAFEDLD